MLTPLRKIKRFARRDVHLHMLIPAVFLATRSTSPGALANVRLHNKFDRTGDVKGSRTYPAEIENIAPRIIFYLPYGVTPRSGAIVSFQTGEAYQIDHILPADDQLQTAYVTQLLPDRAANLPVPSEDGLSIILPGDAG